MTDVTNTTEKANNGQHADSAPVLAIDSLEVRFPKRYGAVSVLDRVDLTVNAGECVAVVGESGCGKSLLGLAAADLLPEVAKTVGDVSYRGRNLWAMSRRDRRKLRGRRAGVVYQDALTSLNPGMTVGAQLRQVCKLGASASPESLLIDVGLTDTTRILRAKPYQLSGGQRQRVLIAIALAREPEVIIADEPTTALDVTVEAQVVRLLQELQAERRFALLFISHDLALVAQLAQRVVIMYAGQIVEYGPTREILARPRHPYTAGLLAASLSLEERLETLVPVPGHVRPPSEFLSGCRFRDRCSRALPECATRPMLNSSDDGGVSCFNPMVDDIRALIAQGSPRVTGVKNGGEAA